jgi:hypothetical protein
LRVEDLFEKIDEESGFYFEKKPAKTKIMTEVNMK